MALIEAIKFLLAYRFKTLPTIDSNLGKHTLDLDLRHPPSRAHFESLLSTTDIILDGYRPTSLARLGYGPSQLLKLALSRNEGIV
ncbi:hypothetical protein ABVK25_006208 [Lepraria finkii]|uniref:Uncharacterized protein n=1 Tax=Lepraria finkii TaxID=1340010 RepID=A0ABR4B923_9LECA